MRAPGLTAGSSATAAARRATPAGSRRRPAVAANFARTLHLLREASIERAVAAFPEAETIYERNIETLQRLGIEGWQALWRKP